jgi:hypothetical protein
MIALGVVGARISPGDGVAEAVASSEIACVD